MSELDTTALRAECEQRWYMHPDTVLALCDEVDRLRLALEVETGKHVAQRRRAMDAEDTLDRVRARIAAVRSVDWAWVSLDRLEADIENVELSDDGA